MATLATSSYKPIIRPISFPNGPTWQTAALQTIGAIPVTMHYQDDVGLFGAENYFLKVETNITESTLFLDSDNVVNGYENVKSGNIYLDSWLDVRLYTSEREEHAYDKMYVRIKDYFYVGVHARNTRRLPYNLFVEIGKEYLTYEEIPVSERKFIMGNGRA